MKNGFQPLLKHAECFSVAGRRLWLEFGDAVGRFEASQGTSGHSRVPFSVGFLTKIHFFDFIQNHQFVHQQHKKNTFRPLLKHEECFSAADRHFRMIFGDLLGRFGASQGATVHTGHPRVLFSMGFVTKILFFQFHSKSSIHP